MPLFFKAAFLLLNIHLLILQSNVNGERAQLLPFVNITTK